MSKIAIVLPAAFWTCNMRPAVETVNCGAKPVPRIASESSLLEVPGTTLELDSVGSASALLLDCGVTLLLDFAEELDAGASPFPATTVIVPLFEAFDVAPVVVTVNLYAPGAAVAETVPEM